MLLIFLAGFAGQFMPGLIFLIAILSPFLAIVFLCGAVFWFSQGILKARNVEGWFHRIGLVISSPLILAFTIGASLPSQWAGKRLGVFADLAIDQSHYDQIIAKAQADRVFKNLAEDGGVTYSVDIGPPIRVAFNPEGMLDNWSAIVFDPTGEMLQADGWDETGKFKAPDHITKLFGGDLVQCRKLWDDYLFCSFT